MTKCIGCKCCVVACNEQNGNPAGLQWRRVGEIEGGYYPHTRRHYLSMGCNHCVEPTCLSGCPVDAYTKDGATGIVLHSADACIGCQYCTWNCSYGVPQYNPERGVVGKCDLCHSRLGLGQAPACATACPTGAILVEIVKIDAWRAATAELTQTAGMPTNDQSLSTTRITMPSLAGKVVKSSDPSVASLRGDGASTFVFDAEGRLRRAFYRPVSEEEIALMVEQCRSQREQDLDESLLHVPEPEEHEGGDEEFDPDEDPLLDRAIEIVVQTQTASVSLIQRRLRVGYTRAGRLIDMLERRGIISGSEGSKPRRVLVGEGDLDRIPS